MCTYFIQCSLGCTEKTHLWTKHQLHVTFLWFDCSYLFYDECNDMPFILTSNKSMYGMYHDWLTFALVAVSMHCMNTIWINIFIRTIDDNDYEYWTTIISIYSMSLSSWTYIIWSSIWIDNCLVYRVWSNYLTMIVKSLVYSSIFQVANH
jgi:hypothetical protein